MERYKYDNTTFEILEKISVPFGVYQYINKRLVTILLSNGFLDFYGYEDKQDTYDLMDNDMFRDIHPDDVAFVADASHRFLEEDDPFDVIYRARIHGEYRIIHAYGKHIYKENGVRLEACWYTDHGSFDKNAEFDSDGGLSASLSVAIIERSAKRTLSYDYLTGFPSMTNFFELANEGCRNIRENGRIPAILFLDFNGMKSYNQKYGMEEGDRFLVAFSKILIKHFSNQNCSRFSADHFCVYTDSEGVPGICESIIEESENICSGRSMPLRIGVYYYDNGDVTISAACDRAKLACDSDKKTFDAHIYYFDKSMVAQLEKERYIVENLDKALEEEWIQVYHQPIFRAANDHICNEEALSRWVDPERGTFSPDEFIPVLEEANSIYKLDLYMVDKVIEKMQGQMAHGVFVVPESVNLSRSDFYTCDLVEEIRKRVDKSELGRDKLIIEITESALADDIDYMARQVARFKELGFSVWMDDYGSGYSSPVVLQKIPFDLIKIDMLFVSQIGETKSSKIIITEIVRMAMALGMETIAEGVENEEQMEFLKEVGCTKLQGFYFARPLSMQDIFDKRQTIDTEMFENPAETDYYVQMGNVNLYDFSISRSDDGSFSGYFDTMPMVLLEVDEKTISIIRCNESFKDFLARTLPKRLGGNKHFSISEFKGKTGGDTLSAIIRCAKEGKRTFVDDLAEDGRNVQVFMRRIAVNPITGVAAVALVILSVVNNDEVQLKQKQAMEKLRKESLVYSRINALSGDYMAIYLIDPVTEDYSLYSSKEYFDTLGTPQMGTDFFASTAVASKKVVYKDDYQYFCERLQKEKILKQIEEDGIFTLNYRLVINQKPLYVQIRANLLHEDDKDKIIMGILNVDRETRKEQEYNFNLMAAREEANIDELTGVKNKHAYVDMEQSLDKDIAEGGCPEFAIAVFDLNDLKHINDTKGHQAGDRYIREGCRIICKAFTHSPVFRLGGDEFAVIVGSGDYERLDENMEKIHRTNLRNKAAGKAVVAAGVSRFARDRNVAAVFARADKEMYKNKAELKK